LICFALIASVSLTSAPTSVAQQPVSAENDAAAESIIFNLSPTGQITIGEETIFTSDLRSEIERAIEQSPNAEIIVHVADIDPDTLMTNINLLEIMNAAREAKVEQLRITK
jgi:biopolymer transport protein ExbD